MASSKQPNTLGPELELISASVTSINCQRFLPLDEAPGGQVALSGSMEITPATRQKKNGVLGKLTLTCKGTAKKDAQNKQRSSDAFFLDLTMEGFFTTRKPHSTFAETDMDENVAVMLGRQLSPIVTSRAVDLLFQMGYHNVRIPLCPSLFEPVQTEAKTEPSKKPTKPKAAPKK